MRELSDGFGARGWGVRAVDSELLAWVRSVAPLVQATVSDPEWAHWLRHGKTWFAGVDALDNDSAGRVGDGPVLPVGLSDWIARHVPLCAEAALPWHRAQLSVVYPGYPRRDAEELRSHFVYRRDRDSAHLDGLLAIGEARRRLQQDFQAFILGIPLENSPAHAAPTVVWEGSHRVLQAVLIEALASVPEMRWSEVELTEVYQAARRRIFERCRRVELRVEPGSCYLIHRFALHGVAPWPPREDERATQRAVCFFRPETGDRQGWLHGE